MPGLTAYRASSRWWRLERRLSFLVHSRYYSPVGQRRVPPPRGGESGKIFAPSGEQVRLVCWRFRLTDYVGVLGYGTKGRNAFRGRRCACRRAVPRDQIRGRPTPTRWPQQAAPAWSPYRARDACRGPAANTDRAGGVVVVAPGRDDTAVLSTLPARRRSPRLTVV